MSGWILNVDADDLAKGKHIAPSPGTYLIQISDPGEAPVQPHHTFEHTLQLQFLDIGADDECDDHRLRINQSQASRIVEFLQQAFFRNYNVVVQCTLGVSRSGAVCQFGVNMGFRDTGAYRAPNLYVLQRLNRTVGW